MAESAPDNKLISSYEDIRRQEYKVIMELLELLPRIDNLDEARIGEVRDALFHADHPFLMVLVGPFSSGKSSLINALLGDEGLLAIGPTPTTDRISILRRGDEARRMDSGGEADTVFYPAPLLKKVSLVDTPGLESVFKTHEEITRKFLHRSDVVLLVMLATQAMTAGNLEYLQKLKTYGKKIIIVINQVDLLTEEERETVRNYVLEQSRDRLGFRPEVWLVSARQGLEARAGELVDLELWEQSGMAQIERYISEQLDDAERLRQKLQTPLQIVQNTHQSALNAVRANQSALDEYQSINENIRQQLGAQKRELQRIIREVNAEVETQFHESARRGGEALRDIFRFSRALALVWRGMLETLFRVLRRPRHLYIRESFTRHKAFEPVDELPAVVDKLGPRLEGRDMQDIDDLVKYSQREIDALPAEMRTKVIGRVQPPVKYDRSALQKVRPELETMEEEARTLETENLDRSVRDTLLYLALWEVLMVALLLAWGAGGGAITEGNLGASLVVWFLLLGGVLLGFAAMPLRGRFLQSAHTSRMLRLQTRYIAALSEAADQQVTYSMQLREDVVAPLTRLIEAQTQIQNEQLTQLQKMEQTLTKIEGELAKLGKKSLFGLRG